MFTFAHFLNSSKRFIFDLTSPFNRTGCVWKIEGLYKYCAVLRLLVGVFFVVHGFVNGNVIFESASLFSCGI